MIPDRLQDFLEHFWIGQRCDQICSDPVFITKILQKIQEVWERPWNIHQSVFVLKIDERYMCSVSVVCLFIVVGMLSTYFFFIKFCEGEDREMMKNA